LKLYHLLIRLLNKKIHEMTFVGYYGVYGGYTHQKQVLTDQGVQFHTTQEGGKIKFRKFCERHRIQHIVASKRRPATIGKVERFHGSYVRGAWRHPIHEAYIHHWNYERLHQGIDYLIPCELYFDDKV